MCLLQAVSVANVNDPIISEYMTLEQNWLHRLSEVTCDLCDIAIVCKDTRWLSFAKLKEVCVCVCGGGPWGSTLH